MKTHNPITSKRGILVGRPLAITMLCAWLLSLMGFIHLLRQNQQLAHLVQTQQNEMMQQREQIVSLQQRLRILEAVEDMQSNLSPDEEVHLAHHVYHYSEKHGLDPLLVLSLIRVESDFTPEAVSPVGALGLMQVMPSTARFIADSRGWDWPGVARLFEPAYNIRLATSYLSDLISKFDRVEEALIAYNWGEGAVMDMIATGQPLPRGFARRVLSTYDWLQRRYGSSKPD